MAACGVLLPHAQNRLVINTPPFPSPSVRSGNSWKTSRKTRDSVLRLLSHVRSLPPPLLVLSLFLFLYIFSFRLRSLLPSIRLFYQPAAARLADIIRNRELYSAENGLRIELPPSHVLLSREHVFMKKGRKIEK